MMKKKALPYYIFLALVVLAAVLFFNNHQGTLSRSSHNFTPPDASKIYKVILSQKGDSITFEKTGDEWVLNNHIPARKDLAELFIITLQRVETVSPAAKIVRKQVAASLRSLGKKVEIFSHGHRTIIYYVLFDSTGVPGTYMMMEQSKLPFLVRLNGYEGANIENLYSLDTKTWRQNTVFQFKPSEISSVLVEYPNDRGNSFEIHLSGIDGFELSGYHRIIPKDKINIQEVKDYLLNFGNVTFKYPEKNSPGMITGNSPFAIITIVDNKNHVTTLKAMRMESTGKADKNYDLDRFYGIIQSDTVILNYADIDPILRNLEDFQKK